MPAKGPIKVKLQGRGPLTLRDSDYVAAGGEGTIYRANATIIKLYTDPAKMTRDGMADKVRLLADRLKHDNIVAPQGVVLSAAGDPVGFYMPFVNGEPLSRFFVSDYRTRNKFADKDAIVLSDRMRNVVQAAHAAQCVMVDANELNWLVQPSTSGTPTPKVIDVDSWAVGRWPATVVMPSIRDWNAKTFDANSDWFGWGILAFQIFTGIHPYKGKVDGYRPGDLVQRMKDNVSVFDPRARLPHSVRDFSCIPGPLLDWFQAEFQQGARSIPPSPMDKTKPAKAAKVMRAVTTATGAILFERLYAWVTSPVVRIWHNGSALLATADLIDMSSGNLLLKDVGADAEIIKAAGGFLVVEMRNGTPQVRFADGHRPLTVDFQMAARRFFTAGDRLFCITDREALELQLRVFAGKAVLSSSRRWPMLMNSTRWFDGVAVQDVMGAKFAFLPIAAGAVQVRVKEIDDLSVVSAIGQERFVALVGLQKDGTYRKVELHFDPEHRSYKAWSGGADSPDLNMAVLPNGVVATIVNDGELVLYVPANGNINKIADRQITTATKLTTWEGRVVYIQDGSVWRVRVKP